MSVSEQSFTATARSYIGGLAHVHTRLSNHPGHHESDLTVSSLIALLAALDDWTPGQAPLEYVLINEHSSNPDRPHPLGRLSLRARDLMRQRRTTVKTIPVLYGLEVSLLRDGRTDLVPRLADNCAVVIASRHRLPASTERDPEAIMELFEKACDNPVVDVIGHPVRNIEDIAAVDWPQVFAWAAQTGTAIELNLNNFPAETEVLRRAFWEQWIHLLGASAASVFIGTDLHNALQVEQFRDLWRGLDDARRPNRLRQVLECMIDANITPQRVVNSELETLQTWRLLDKQARAQLSLR